MGGRRMRNCVYLDVLETRDMMCADISATYFPGVVDGVGASVFVSDVPECEVPTNGTAAGDINGDGLGDLIFGDPTATTEGGVPVGKAYVVFGHESGQIPSFAELDGTNGFEIIGYLEDGELGWAVGAAGDLNGDGIDDVAVGAPNANPNGLLVGQVYVVYGSSDQIGASIEVENLGGTDGFAIDGVEAGDGLGAAIDAAGDFNGDGFDDLLIAAPNATRDGVSFAGEAYVIFGGDEIDNVVDLFTIDASQGMIIADRVPSNVLGHSVAGIGDLNGDGLSDIAVGTANHNGAFREELGYAFVVFGDSSPPAQISPEDLVGTNGFLVQASGAMSYVSGAGDFNGDGRVDLAIADDDAADGQTHLIFGNTTFPAFVEAARDLDRQVFDEEFGVTVTQRLGGPVAGLGDINGDGFDDVLASASADLILEVDSSQVLFGSPGFESYQDSTLLDNSEALNIIGIVEFGFGGQRVAPAGDFNGDGLSDFIVSSGGVSYLFFGAVAFNAMPQQIPERGDANRDAVIDVEDIDHMALVLRLLKISDEIDMNGDSVVDESDELALAALDLNSDDTVNAFDRDVLIDEIFGTSHGDANLDGLVGFDDFLALSSGFGYFGAGWSGGDFNGDGFTDFEDFLLLSLNFNDE